MKTAPKVEKIAATAGIGCKDIKVSVPAVVTPAEILYELSRFVIAA